MLAASRIALGAPSTSSLASFRPRPETISRTALITPIFFAPASVRTTSNSSFSSSAAASAPGAAATAATGAAAVTSKTSSNSLTNSESSMRVISLNASMSSSLVSLAMVGILSLVELF
ncbi:50S ribosomal protein L7/L12 [Corynebacterium casei LMG S-19264]|uniref:50S ribosomal protein L7/L12 n=1 Tax=Corynebacterium casei LMG S-19264 TaxID=1285583 RepID=A0ABN4CDF6_9CORY|nr:50S ribosomal protein L7/L12 [Corynebacterium casei LMG S-19264]